MESFTFQMTKEAFYDDIFMAIFSPGHAGDNTIFFGIRLKLPRCIKTSLN